LEEVDVQLPYRNENMILIGYTSCTISIDKYGGPWCCQPLLEEAYPSAFSLSQEAVDTLSLNASMISVTFSRFFSAGL